MPISATLPSIDASWLLSVQAHVLQSPPVGPVCNFLARHTAATDTVTTDADTIATAVGVPAAEVLEALEILRSRGWVDVVAYLDRTGPTHLQRRTFQLTYGQ